MTRSKRADLLKQRNEAEHNKTAREQKLENLRVEVKAIQSRLETDIWEDLKLQKEENLKRKLENCQELENEITGFNKSIEDIDEDLMDIDENGGEDGTAGESEEANTSERPDLPDPLQLQTNLFRECRTPES
jgi:chromosome segregation ATPase